MDTKTSRPQRHHHTTSWAIIWLGVLSELSEALYEGYTQKGFGFLSPDGSTAPLGLTALPRSLPGHIALSSNS